MLSGGRDALAPGEIGPGRPHAAGVEVQEAAVQQQPGQHPDVRVAVEQRHRRVKERQRLADPPRSHEQQAALGEQDPEVGRRGHLLGHVKQAKPLVGPALFRLHVGQGYQQPGDDRPALS